MVSEEQSMHQGPRAVAFVRGNILSDVPYWRCLMCGMCTLDADGAAQHIRWHRSIGNPVLTEEAEAGIVGPVVAVEPKPIVSMPRSSRRGPKTKAEREQEQAEAIAEQEAAGPDSAVFEDPPE